MPRRTRLPASTIGAITKLCACGSRVQLSMICCSPCWRQLPRSLQQAYLTAKDGDCDSGPALAVAETAIRDHVRKAAVR